MDRLKTFVIVFTVGLAAIACADEPECIRINNSLAGVTFKSLPDGALRDIPFDEISALGTSVLLAVDSTLNTFVVPLNYFETQTTVRFSSGTERDSLVLGYTTQTQFISEECGERYVLSNLHVITHSFDSIRVVGSTPGKDISSKNLEIFFDE